MAGLINLGSGYLATGQEPRRWGNAHATIVPYQLFQASDRPFVLAVGNDHQWRRCCDVLGQAAWADDTRFATNPQRVAHRATLVPLLQELLEKQPAEHWLSRFGAAGVAASPVNTLQHVFDDVQVRQQGLRTPVEHPSAGVIELLGIPFVLSHTPAVVRLPPPLLGQHTAEVLLQVGFSPGDIAAWRTTGIV